MKLVLVPTVAAALIFGLAAHAQDAIEYHSTGVKSAMTGITLPSKLAAAVSGDKSAANSAQPKMQTAGQAGQPGQQTVAPAPLPPKVAVFILNNGEKIESSRYMLSSNSVQIDQNGTERTIPLNELNRTATMEANRQRGVDLQIPTSKSQITLSF